MDPSVIIANPIGFAEQYLAPLAIRLIIAGAIWIIGYWLAGKLTAFFRSMLTRAHLDTMLVQFLGNIAYTALLAVVAIAVLDQLGVHTTSLIAVFGAAGLAVGLALKDSLGNFASGVMLILFRPFKVGDQIDAAGISGVVEEIRIFSTRLRTPDNREIIAPNGSISNSTIVNYNTNPTRRIDLTLSISYNDDIRQAKTIIERIATADERSLSDPPVTINVSELAANSVNLGTAVWTKTENYGALRATLLEKIKLAFDEAGFTLPCPQREIHTCSTDTPQNTPTPR